MMDMGVSKSRYGTPKWMVKIMENLIKMDDLGIPLFSETPIWMNMVMDHGGIGTLECRWDEIINFFLLVFPQG